MSDRVAHAGQTVETTRRVLTTRFKTINIESPELDARLLAGTVLSLDLTGLITQAARHLTADEADRLNAFAQRRVAGEPVARILGMKEFWGLPLAVSAATLIPRPDTETVIEAALDHLRANGRIGAPLRIADLGTGTGAILLALLSELPEATGIGTDISEAALETARRNAANLGLASRTDFIVSDYADGLSDPFDLIVSNPPYIRSTEIATLAIEVRSHDPHLALDGGLDGLDAYRRIAPQAAQRLAPGSLLVVEIGQGQADDVTALMTAAGLTITDPPKPDLAGIVRAVTGRKLPR